MATKKKVKKITPKKEIKEEVQSIEQKLIRKKGNFPM